MNGKRFTIIDCGILGKCLRDNQSDINTGDLVIMSEWLNELHEENEQLRHDATILIQSNQDYRRENEQLKQSYKEFEDECQSTFNAMSRKQNDLYRKNFKLKEENEQLKCGNKNLKATLNDFINICNRLQANPNDKQTLAVARDMLQNMGKELEE